MAVSLWPSDLIAGLNRVEHAAATEYARPVLCGVLFTGTADGMVLAAADNYRIAEATVPVREGDPEAFGAAIVRIEDIGGIRWMLKGAAKSTIALTVERGEPWYAGGPTTVIFTHLDRTLTLRPIDGKFPNYRIVFDQAAAVEQRVVNVQAKYLRDAAKAIGNREFGVALEIGDPLTPIVVRAAGDDAYREAIMPIKTHRTSRAEAEKAAADEAERSRVAREVA